MNNDDSEYEPIFMATVFTIDLENGDIYYSEYPTRSTVKKLTASGKTIEINPEFSTEFQLHGGYVYFVDQNDFRLYRTHLSNGTSEQVSQQQISSQYTLSEDYAYHLSGKMYRVNLESLEETVIYDDNVISLTINNGWIYFVTFDKEKLKELPKYTTGKDAFTARTLNKMLSAK